MELSKIIFQVQKDHLAILNVIYTSQEPNNDREKKNSSLKQGFDYRMDWLMQTVAEIF
tara:strand:- start:3799 stop:3972 length:174 start_codon:yes stop_codon:yes gene_type:complete